MAQGFAWDAGTVAFGVPDHDGLCRLSLDTDRQTPYQPTDATLWAIAVPFDAPNGEIEAGTILDAWDTEDEAGGPMRNAAGSPGGRPWTRAPPAIPPPSPRAWAWFHHRGA